MKVIHLISGGDVGGAKTHVLSLLHGLCQTQTVQLVCFMDGPFAEEARQLDIPTKIVKSHSITNDCRTLHAMIERDGYDVIHCHGARANMMGAILKRKLNIPVVTTVHSDYRLDYLGRPIHRLTFGTINTIALRLLDYRIGVSDSMVRLLVARGFDPQKMFSIYNGVDFSAAHPRMDRQTFFRSIGLEVPEDGVVFGIAARISPVKDMTTLVRAFAAAWQKNQNIRLVIAGDGEQAAQIKALARQLCPEHAIVFAGWLDDTDSFYQAIDVNMLTSLSETFPYALTEGARMHCATIASRVGGIPDLIEHGVQGLLFEPRDVETLAGHISLLATDHALRRQMQQALYEKALREYSAEATVQRQIQIYSAILRRTARRRTASRDGILICGAYGRGNAGDDAILQAIIDQMRHVDGDMPLYVLSRNPRQTRLCYRVGSCHIFNFLAYRRLMRRTKLYISGGGTLIQNATSNRSLWYYLHSIRLAHRTGNRVMLYGCGIGPVYGTDKRRRCGKILNECADMITLRDDKCAEELEQMGVCRPEIHITADPALLLAPAKESVGRSLLAANGLQPDCKYAMFALRPWENFSEHIPEFAAAAEMLYETHGMIPAFFALEPARDLWVIDQICPLLHCPYVKLEPPGTSAEIISLFRRMSLVVSMRLHALIFAAGQRVPLLGIVYDPKVDGFLDYLGQDHKMLYMPLRQLTQQRLEQMIEQTLQNGQISEQNITRLQTLARENETYVRKVLEG